jgi:hypothetical protein
MLSLEGLCRALLAWYISTVPHSTVPRSHSMTVVGKIFSVLNRPHSWKEKTSFCGHDAVKFRNHLSYLLLNF